MTSPQYTTLAYTLQAGETTRISIYSDFLSCLEASARFKISFDGSPATDFLQGLTFQPERTFREVEISNPNGTALEVTLAFGQGGVRDSRLNLVGTVNTDAISPDTFTTGAPVSLADAATTLIAAADANRRELILVNRGAGVIYIGGASGATAGQGIDLQPAQTLILTTSAAVYGRNDTGAAVDVAAASLGLT